MQRNFKGFTVLYSDMIEYVKDEVFINVGMAEGSSYPVKTS